ncbi:stage II sporulation protein spoIIQ [Salinibacillus aidingensis]|uniref:Stage II sporulation protein spoIIQ n=1 Tax=Salinibacillus aidingensis TaxID=237684 RepID=A0ABN1AZI4_9BACI
MNEEGKNPNSKNSGWRKLVRKKWFYPAVYLTFAALVLTGVLWYQNAAIDLPEEEAQDQTDQLDSENTDQVGERPEGDSVPVIEQDEQVMMPVANAKETEIVTKFYDYNASEKEQEQALVLYNNKYYQSKGIDIASTNEEPFDVTAALSGKVTDVKDDPLLGMVVELTHENGVTTNYASLEDVTVDSGAKVEQGDVIGTAGQNLYGQANGIHVHFELRKDGTRVDPEEYFNKSLSEIKLPSDGNEEDGDQEDGNEEDGTEEDGASEDGASEDGATDDEASDEETSGQEENTDDQGDSGDEDNGSDGEEDDSTDVQPESSASSATA